MIGKLEEVVLLAALKARANAVPSVIYETILEANPPGTKAPAFGAVYTTLNRMAVKKMLNVSEAVDDSGRNRRQFTVSAIGMQALQGSIDHSYALGAFGLARV